VVSGDRFVGVRLACLAGRPAGWCAGPLAVTVRVQRERRSLTILLARGRYRLRGARRATVRLRIRLAGRALLRKRRGGRLTVRVSAGTATSRRLSLGQP
jgi:hypothetical protein